MKKEVVLSQKKVLTTRMFTVREDTVRVPSGDQRTFSIVEHPGAVVIIPVAEDGSMLMVRQWRRAVGRELIEFPAGTLEVGEAPIECAKRELIEETSHEGKEWFDMGSLLPAPGFCNERQYCFVAKGLVPRPGELDEDEIIEVERFTRERFLELARDGDLLDSKSLAIYMRAVAKGLL